MEGSWSAVVGECTVGECTVVECRGRERGVLRDRGVERLGVEVGVLLDGEVGWRVRSSGEIVGAVPTPVGVCGIEGGS